MCNSVTIKLGMPFRRTSGPKELTQLKKIYILYQLILQIFKHFNDICFKLSNDIMQYLIDLYRSLKAEKKCANFIAWPKTGVTEFVKTRLD